ncbi:HAD family phosphatase [Ruminococcus sp.]|uniref:HAD family hydrolase n=1 Tax=Ruminococcus sp. TaxID=41978 RepID=UPI0025DCF84F|nr:HAD family phosphatase [Ruminococcus sp.]MBQ8966126.1 HAD family phosphatase [Ruminococcus sp.]
MKINGLIFDMDGLMVDTEKLLTRFWREAAAFYGWEMTQQHVLGIRSLAGKYAGPKLQAEVSPDFDYAKVRLKRIELMNAYIAENGIEKKPGLDELIAYGREKGLRLAVATATDNVRTKLYLESIGVYHFFDKVVCGNMVKSSKPDPDIYLTASAELGLPPAQCIALEDSPNGIKSAKSAGCVPVFVPDLSQPDPETASLMFACCKTLADVIDVVEDLNR